jgi:hypothetical protein
MATTFVDRVATEAMTVRPVKLLLTLLTLPFYVVGWVLGLLFVVVMFAVGAVKVGIADARERADRSRRPLPPAREGG